MRDSLARVQTAPVLTPGQIDALAARAWHDHGIVLLRPEDVNEADDRQALTAAAERRYGPRQA
jgi:hypothetical protein